MRTGIAGLIAVSTLVMTSATASVAGTPHHEPRRDQHSTIRSVVTFGDSWSSANVVYGTKPGGSWSQLLAAKFGIRQRADTAGGSNYARGGAFVAPIAPFSTTASPSPVSAQIDDYLASRGRFHADQLVTLWAGGNDLFAYLGGFGADAGDPNAPTSEQFCAGTQTPAQLDAIAAKSTTIADAQVSAVKRILARGARHVVLLDIVDLDLTANDACMSPDANSIAGLFTKLLNQATRAKLAASGLDRDERVAFIPISKLFYRVAAQPARYGFKVVDGDACDAPACTGPREWKTPDADRTYVFAQSGHFTRHTRKLIAHVVAGAVHRAWPKVR